MGQCPMQRRRPMQSWSSPMRMAPAVLLLLLLFVLVPLRAGGQHQGHMWPYQQFQGREQHHDGANSAWQQMLLEEEGSPGPRGMQELSQNLEVSVHAEWGQYFTHLCSLHVGNQGLCPLLGPLLQYNFSLTPTQLRQGATYIGPNRRLRRVVRDLFTGHANVSIGVIGTSVAYGTGENHAATHTHTHTHTRTCQTPRSSSFHSSFLCPSRCLPAWLY